MTDKVTKTDAEWRAQLSPEAFAVTRQHATERPGSGVYNDETRKGIYACICCGQELFASETKFDAGCGWPSYWQPIAADRVTLIEDRSLGMIRTEVLCSKCDAHLGHVFPDGPQPTGDRYCMNSVALDLKPEE